MELLVLGGRSPAHAISMLIPEAFLGRPELPQEVRDFYAYHSSLVEPWDGPAAVAFTDGRVIGATLDRNGLRPGRWLVTRDGWVVMASETGVLDSADGEIVAKGRLRPGKLFLVDLEQRPHRARRRAQARAGRAASPTASGCTTASCTSRTCPRRARACRAWSRCAPSSSPSAGPRRTCACILAPMARDAAEPTGSMGNDVALAVLSDRRPPLFSYFKQLFAQVTNPAIDPIRESVVMSLEACIGPEINLLGETPDHCHQLVMAQPILRNTQLEKLRQVDHSVFEARTIDMTWSVEEGEAGMQRRLDEICARGHRAGGPRREHHHPVRPQHGSRARGHALAAGRGRGPPPPGARGHPAPDRPGGGDRRGPRDPPHRLA